MQAAFCRLGKVLLTFGWLFLEYSAIGKRYPGEHIHLQIIFKVLNFVGPRQIKMSSLQL
jgi:hypothetical protein